MEFEILKILVVLSGIVNILLTVSVLFVDLEDFLGLPRNYYHALVTFVGLGFFPLHDTSRSDMEFVDGILIPGPGLHVNFVLFSIIEG